MEGERKMKNKHIKVIKPTKDWIEEVSLKNKSDHIGRSIERLTMYAGDNLTEGSYGKISLYKIYMKLTYRNLKGKRGDDSNKAIYLNSIRCLHGHGKLTMDFKYIAEEEIKLPENEKIRDKLIRKMDNDNGIEEWEYSPDSPEDEDWIKIKKYKFGRSDIDLKPLKLIHFVSEDDYVDKECPINLSDLIDFEIINLGKRPLEILVQELNSRVTDFESTYLRLDEKISFSEYKDH